MARGINIGVSATVVTPKMTQGTQGARLKKAAMDAANAPNATHKKKKCVGGGRISITVQTAATINQIFHGVIIIIGSPLSAEAASRQTTLFL